MANAGSPFLDFSAPVEFGAEWFHRACAALDIDQLLDRIVSRCVNVFPAEVVDARFADFLRSSVAENLQVLRDLLSGCQEFSVLTLQQPMLFASVQAELGVPQTSLQRSYRVSFLTVWETWTDSLQRTARELGIDPDETAMAVSHLTRAVFTYQDFVTSQAAENYARVDAALSRSKARVQHQLIRELLEGGGEPLATADLSLLEYDVHSHHLAILLPACGESAAARVARDLKSATRLRESLAYKTSLESTVLWLGSPTAWTPHALAAVDAVLQQTVTAAVLGETHPGPEGLVASFREAMVASQIRKPGSGRVITKYADVMLDVVLMQSPTLAEQFVRSTLGPLAEDSSDARRLCETLEASLQCGSHVAAAELLGVHEHTVRNRLAKADELIGGSVRERRTEVEVALRMRAVLRSSGPPST